MRRRASLGACGVHQPVRRYRGEENAKHLAHARHQSIGERFYAPSPLLIPSKSSPLSTLSTKRRDGAPFLLCFLSSRNRSVLRRGREEWFQQSSQGEEAGSFLSRLLRRASVCAGTLSFSAGEQPRAWSARARRGPAHMHVVENSQPELLLLPLPTLTSAVTLLRCRKGRGRQPSLRSRPCSFPPTPPAAGARCPAGRRTLPLRRRRPLCSPLRVCLLRAPSALLSRLGRSVRMKVSCFSVPTPEWVYHLRLRSRRLRLFLFPT